MKGFCGYTHYTHYPFNYILSVAQTSDVLGHDNVSKSEVAITLCILVPRVTDKRES